MAASRAADLLRFHLVCLLAVHSVQSILQTVSLGAFLIDWLLKTIITVRQVDDIQ
jgi:hypothetical protein